MNGRTSAPVTAASGLHHAWHAVRLETLMVPTDPPDGSVLDRRVRRKIRGQAGLSWGLRPSTMTGLARRPTVLLERGPPRVPDVAAEAIVVFPVDRRPLVEGTIWGLYTVDAITNLIVGGGWFSERQVADLAVGSDLRVGRFTVRTFSIAEMLVHLDAIPTLTAQY